MDPTYFSTSSWQDRLRLWLDGHGAERSFLDANVEAIQRYMAEPATGLRMVVNIPADALISFCAEGEYRNITFDESLSVRFNGEEPAGEPKAMLTDYVSTLRPARLRALDQALRVALALA